MTWGIIGALDAEVALLREKMTIEEERRAYGSTYSIGSIGGQRVVVVCCSVGTINAAVCTSTLIREFGAERVINCGIAGAGETDLGILDVVLSSDVVFHDADLDILVKYYPFQDSFEADEDMVELAEQAIASLPGRRFSHRVGRVASGDVFVSDRAEKNRIVEKFHPQCIEMEGASVGQVAFMNETPFLVIRTLSDNADEEADTTYDSFLDRAAQNSAEIVLAMLALADRE